MTTYKLKRFSSEIDPPTAYIMIGVPGAGKSTWIKNNHPNLPVISRDIIRERFGFAKPGQKMVGNPTQEQRVTQEQDFLLKNYIQEKVDFCIDNTNLDPKYLQPIMRALNEASYRVIAIRLNTPLEVCLQRRSGQIPQEAMERMWSKFKDLNLGMFGFKKVIEVNGI